MTNGSPTIVDKPGSRSQSASWTFSSAWVVAAILLLGVAERGAVSIHPYSGENKPPMFGDYEAQRHWMELTLSIPVSDWYRNTSDNNLLYWGLDYPPLSGYASWLFGKFLHSIEPEAVALHTSRGYESPSSRVIMRLSVIASDVLCFFPAVVLLCHILYSERKENSDSMPFLKTVAFCVTLPALMLIDHGHFQYNGLSLGFFLLSLSCFFCEREALGASMFCCSVYFKQMGLYYGLAIFSFLLARMVSIIRRDGLVHGISFALKILRAITITTFVTFRPWISDPERLREIICRLFPVSRGLYEGKVGNVWCSASVLVKINKLMEKETLFAFCAVTTAVASFPFCVALAKRHTPTRLLLATSGCSLAAYLFSYQVHEKQILIPLVPLAMLYGRYPLLATWASMASTFSLFPLLYREGLSLAYVAVIGIHCGVILMTWGAGEIFSGNYALDLGACMCAAIAIVLNSVIAFCEPPLKAPDLFVLLNTSYACLHFCAIYALVLFYMYNDIEGQSRETRGATEKTKEE